MTDFEWIVKRFVADLVRWATHAPAKPGPFVITVTGEQSPTEGEPMRKNITDIAFPALPPDNPDGVVKRRFSIVETGSQTVIFPEQDFAFDTPGVVGVKLAQGIEVMVSIADMDQANNLGEAQEQPYTPSDVTAPAKPGEFGFTVTGEVDEP